VRDLFSLRFGLGIALAAVIALGLGWLVWPAIRRRLPGAERRRAHTPQKMIDVPLDRNAE
jgi:hypothetical protein